MENIAPVNHPVNSLIAKRWSPRSFQMDHSIDRAKLATIFEAVRWAPSASNLQPWRFIVGVDYDDTHTRIFGSLKEGNQRWAKAAPVLVVALVALNLADGSGPNRHAFHDVGLALENLFLQAADLGLNCHLMAGFDADIIMQSFRVPDGYEPITACALGYPGKLEDLAEDLQVRELMPRRRKALEDFVFGGTWGASLDLA